MPRTPSHTRRSPSFHRALVVCAVAIAAVTTTVATVAVERQGARERERAVVDAAAHALEREMAVRAAALRGAQGLIAASDRVEAAEFRRFGRLALGSGSDATWHPVVREPGRVAFERAVAPIAALDAAGNRRAAAVRDLYLPAALGATSGGASWHLGVDLLSDPWRAAAADRAIASGTLAVSPAVALPTPSRPQGLVLVLPVYGTAPDVPPPAERRARLSGVVVDSVPLALLERRVRSGLPDEVSLVIEAGSREVADGPDASTRTGGQWMHIHVTSRFRAQVRLPLAVGVAGFAIVLLTALLMRQAGRRDQEVRAALAHQSEARTAAESALRLREDRFRVLAQEVPVGICILTPEGIVEFANQRCAELLGVSIAGLVGESLVRPAVAGADRERFADALRVAVRDGERLSTAVGIRHPNGDEARLRVQAVPAGTGADRRHLCTVTDITDEHLRELRERALAQVAAVVASDPGMEAVMEAASAARDAVPGGADDPAFAGRLAELMTMARSAAEAKAALTARAERDPLTGLGNRRVFWDALREAVAQGAQGRSSALVLLDLDHFKRVNDTHGHTAGDDVLREIAGRLRRSARGSDLVCRVGGEEFAWLMPDTGTDGARVAVGRLLEWVRTEPFPLVGRLTCSAGACAVDGGIGPEEIYQRADEALYAAKHGGRDTLRVHGDSAGITPSSTC